MTTAAMENVDLHHQVASENYRLATFASLVNFPLVTRRQLALAGFIYRQSTCVCVRCNVTISLQQFDENTAYSSNHFRKLHRDQVSHLNKQCTFLLCQSGTNIDDLHPFVPSNPQWDNAEHPEFSNYNTRLETFTSWPHHLSHEGNTQNTIVTPSAMAKHGFFFTGPDDGVTCFYCGNTLTQWSEARRSNNENIIQLEHARFFPCHFINYTSGGKFVATAHHFHTVSHQERQARNPISYKTGSSAILKPTSIDDCVSTYEHWPEYAPVSANALAAAGFYYLGDQLKVKCYACDLEVSDWCSGMTAIGIHQQRSHDCEFLQALDSISSGDVQSVNEKWRLQTLDGFPFACSHETPRRSVHEIQNLCCELAACGFYRYKNTLNIRCAYCGVVIEPHVNHSIMFQHRSLAKQLICTLSTIDCPMVRAVCPTNIVIPDRQRYPERPEYQSIISRRQSFESYQKQHTIDEQFISERAEAGFFVDTLRRMRCFQCGNSLPIHSKRLQNKYPQYNTAKLHAHFYPTCEWVQEILGVKYIAQVLLDRKKSNQFEREHSSMTDTSSELSPVPFVFLPITSSHSSTEIFSATTKSNEHFDLSDYYDDSDDDSYELVAKPFQARFTAVRSPLPSPTGVSHELSPTQAAQSCADPIPGNDQSSFFSPLMGHTANPFKYSPANPISLPIDLIVTDISPVDTRAYFAHEINRLESFKIRHRTTFAQIPVEELAYAGFYLDREDNTVECPWCDIRVTEQRFGDVMYRRPIIPGSPLNGELWTPMRVHRHENGQLIDNQHSWCSWVRRESTGLYTNVMRPESIMAYPEYPSYSNIEKRIQSFQSTWLYQSGSLLSNAAMAEAGFIHLGHDKVCCYYCGNRLFDFKPRDCPFEEHATFHPLCDYILAKRGLPYVQQISLESERCPQARQKSEIHDGKPVKIILFEPSGLSPKKTNRKPANRTVSAPPYCVPVPNPVLSHPTIDSSFDEPINDCETCCENAGVYLYKPCEHFPMCEICCSKLSQEQRETCSVCRAKATIASRFAIVS